LSKAALARNNLKNLLTKEAARMPEENYKANAHLRNAQERAEDRFAYRRVFQGRHCRSQYADRRRSPQDGCLRLKGIVPPSSDRNEP
jgi:hypothetical protein